MLPGSGLTLHRRAHPHFLGRNSVGLTLPHAGAGPLANLPSGGEGDSEGPPRATRGSRWGTRHPPSTQHFLCLGSHPHAGQRGGSPPHQVWPRVSHSAWPGLLSTERAGALFLPGLWREAPTSACHTDSAALRLREVLSAPLRACGQGPGKRGQGPGKRGDPPRATQPEVAGRPTPGLTPSSARRPPGEVSWAHWVPRPLEMSPPLSRGTHAKRLRGPSRPDSDGSLRHRFEQSQEGSPAWR